MTINPGWRSRIDVSDVFHADIPWVEKMATIAARVREQEPLLALFGYQHLADDIAEAEDAEEFDELWAMLYDWADECRVWVATR